MKIIEKIVEILSVILPFLRRKDGKQLKEFSELITNQYGFLVEQLEKALRDYFELGDRVKELHAEIVALRGQLAQSTPERCLDHGCKKRRTGILLKMDKPLLKMDKPLLKMDKPLLKMDKPLHKLDKPLHEKH